MTHVASCGRVQPRGVRNGSLGLMLVRSETSKVGAGVRARGSIRRRTVLAR